MRDQIARVLDLLDGAGLRARVREVVDQIVQEGGGPLDVGGLLLELLEEELELEELLLEEDVELDELLL